MTTDGGVTAADIARLAGVGRAAVSNWRRRHADFPQPTGGTMGSPTFDLEDVQRWLVANDRLAVHEMAVETPTGPPDSSPLARALAALAPPMKSGLIIDPACVDGDALAAVISRFGGHLSYVAQSFSPSSAAKNEWLLHGLAPTAHVVAGEPFDDTLAEHLGHADAVVSIPPASGAVAIEKVFHDRWEFGPPAKGDVPLAWAQIAFAYLKPGGIAVIALPFVAAARASGRRIRAELLRTGSLTHAVALPEEVGPSSQIWVLRKPTARPGYTLRMVDLTRSTIETLPRSTDDWQVVFDDPELTRDVPAIELLDEDVFLIPSAHIANPPRDVGPEYRDRSARYAGLARSLGKRQPPTFDSTKPTGLPTVGVADLQRLGALEIRDKDEPEPGDVIVPSGPNRFDSITVAGHTNDGERSATVIRCDPNQVDPYFLACFLRSEANRRQAIGTQGGTFRLDLRRARVPRIPLTEQRRYGEAFRRLTEFAARADELAAAAHDAIRTAVYGLTEGVLAPPGDSADRAEEKTQS